jgi:hypothetical protein
MRWNTGLAVASNWSWAVTSSLAAVGSGLRAGSESAITVRSAGPYFAAEPNNARGRSPGAL